MLSCTDAESGGVGPRRTVLATGHRVTFPGVIRRARRLRAGHRGWPPRRRLDRDESHRGGRLSESLTRGALRLRPSECARSSAGNVAAATLSCWHATCRRHGVDADAFAGMVDDRA